MHTIALFGAGKIGEAITVMLSASGRYKVRVCDHNLEHAKRVAALADNTESHSLNLSDPSATKKILQGTSAVISALPFHCNVDVAKLARELNIHYFDLTEDVETSGKIAALAKDSKVGFMPQCGLAPGFISIAAAHLIKSFEQVDTVKMRVGALPIYPSNQLKYNLTWSTEGLINEYGNLCSVIEDGKLMTVLPLEGYEQFSLDGVEYEAFNTSGGLGSLADVMQGQCRKLDYKSVRYPGHHRLITFLMNDLRFTNDRETLKAVFERSISTTAQDKCVVFVEVRGTSAGRFRQRTYASTVYNGLLNGKHFGAIQITTASGICVPVDLLLSGKLSKASGFLRSEDISLTEFTDHEFGRYYKDEKALAGIAV